MGLRSLTVSHSGSHRAGVPRYLGRSSARRSSPWAPSSSTPCGTPGTAPLARAASRKACLGRQAVQAGVRPLLGQEPGLQPLPLLPPFPPGLLPGHPAWLSRPGEPWTWLVSSPSSPCTGGTLLLQERPSPRPSPTNLTHSGGPDPPPKPQPMGQLTCSPERLPIVCERAFPAGCDSYPHFAGGETEAQRV